MRVFVNDVEVSVFEGARVKDAVNKYSSQLLIKVERGKQGVKVNDIHGNPVMSDGSLSENDHIYVNTGSKS